MKRLLFAVALLLLGAHAHAQTSEAEVQADLLAIEIAAAVEAKRLTDAAKLLDEYATLGVSMPPPLMLQGARVYFKLKRYADAEVQLREYLKKIERGSKDYQDAVLMLAEVKPKAAPEMEARRAAAEAKRAAKAKAEAAAKAKRVAVAKAKAAEAEALRKGLPGARFRECTDCPEMVIVPAGVFTMGSPRSEEGREKDEGPKHQVTVGKFAVGKYEVTFDEWEACRRARGCSRNPEDEGWGKGNRPVINVSWDDAKEYVKWLSRETGKRYRLLSESEWEYAARAGTNTPYHTGRTISSSQANYSYNHGKTVAVGSYPANQFGLHNMHGNVVEWVEDCSHYNYRKAPSNGRAWTTDGDRDCTWRVMRGGAWNVDAPWLRAAVRTWNPIAFRYSSVGFRVARTLTP